MQAKLYGRVAADPGRRFDDLFNFVHDPATLYVAYRRIESNRGANTPGVDGMTVRLVEQRIGVREFLDDLRAQLKTGTLWPLPVRERKIPQAGRGRRGGSGTRSARHRPSAGPRRSSGAAKAAERYAIGRPRVQFQNKNQRGWAEFAEAVAGIPHWTAP